VYGGVLLYVCVSFGVRGNVDMGGCRCVCQCVFVDGCVCGWMYVCAEKLQIGECVFEWVRMTPDRVVLSPPSCQHHLVCMLGLYYTLGCECVKYHLVLASQSVSYRAIFVPGLNGRRRV
jgi:hypothetical protein